MSAEAGPASRQRVRTTEAILKTECFGDFIMLTRGALEVFQTGNAGAIVTLGASHRHFGFFCVGRLARCIRVRGWLGVSVDDMAEGVSSREDSFESVVNARSPFVAYGWETALLDKEQF